LVISVIGRKGGVGKTTTALNLAGALADQGYAVTMIDLDPQSSLSRLADTTQAPSVRDLGPQAEHRAARGGAAAWLATQLAGAGVYVLDTPPQLGAILDAAVAVADRVLLPTRLGQQDIDSLLDTLERAPAALVVANYLSTPGSMRPLPGQTPATPSVPRSSWVSIRAPTDAARQRTPWPS
jgi:cellulose biosynthesis protein BcsQ